MESKHSCPVCGNYSASPKGTYSKMLGLVGKIDTSVYLCNSCRVLYLWPYMSREGISGLYGSSYFTGEADQIDSDLPATGSDYETEFAMERIDKFNSTIKLLLKFNPRAKNILDVGAATGTFLSIAREYNLDTQGVEYSEYAAHKALEKYGENLFVGDFLDFDTNERYDLIHLNHVFEHMVTPIKVVNKIKAMLSEFGLVYIEVPFQFNQIEVIKYKLTGKKKKFDTFSLHHPIFYKPSVLKSLFEQYGFKCEMIRVFNKQNYPAETILSKMKRCIWNIFSLMDQGLVIEAVFSKVSKE